MPVMTRTVVVSGGGSGIGRAVAITLAEGASHVTVVGRRTGPLEALAEAHPGTIDLVTADVSTPDGARRVADHLASSGHGCAGVVAAAGGLSPRHAPGDGLAEVEAGWQAAFRSNVLTAVLLVEALTPALRDASGRVVLLSSVAALRGSGAGPYGAMKSALHAWMFDLARDLGHHGGTANAVAPGFVPDTEFWAGRLDDDVIRRKSLETLVGRPGTTHEVASLIAWLLGPDGGWVTGQILSPNGGSVLGR
ncbi:SDR family oxidoreductase [Cellulomonas humilata]|uniref:SDR family oxidoreductase n=2 Tax=Cellulomonas humilata TaxID=144055 RepID=A0A7Y6A2U5_9CELL|nr:SDR family oxidoreductase [Cellulomonas humilata]